MRYFVFHVLSIARILNFNSARKIQKRLELLGFFKVLEFKYIDWSTHIKSKREKSRELFSTINFDYYFVPIW